MPVTDKSDSNESQRLNSVKSSTATTKLRNLGVGFLNMFKKKQQSTSDTHESFVTPTPDSITSEFVFSSKTSLRTPSQESKDDPNAAQMLPSNNTIEVSPRRSPSPVFLDVKTNHNDMQNNSHPATPNNNISGQLLSENERNKRAGDLVFLTSQSNQENRSLENDRASISEPHAYSMSSMQTTGSADTQTFTKSFILDDLKPNAEYSVSAHPSIDSSNRENNDINLASKPPAGSSSTLSHESATRRMSSSSSSSMSTTTINNDPANTPSTSEKKDFQRPSKLSSHGLRTRSVTEQDSESNLDNQVSLNC